MGTESWKDSHVKARSVPPCPPCIFLQVAPKLEALGLQSLAEDIGAKLSVHIRTYSSAAIGKQSSALGTPAWSEVRKQFLNAKSAFHGRNFT